VAVAVAIVEVEEEDAAEVAAADDAGKGIVNEGN
jgi:hypothetical protein